jgi:hypothetical protein
LTILLLEEKGPLQILSLISLKILSKCWSQRVSLYFLIYLTLILKLNLYFNNYIRSGNSYPHLILILPKLHTLQYNFLLVAGILVSSNITFPVSATINYFYMRSYLSTVAEAIEKYTITKRLRKLVLEQPGRGGTSSIIPTTDRRIRYEMCVCILVKSVPSRLHLLLLDI